MCITLILKILRGLKQCGLPCEPVWPSGKALGW